MRRVVFVGPSLPGVRSIIKEAATNIEVYPPVCAGQLLAIPLEPGDAVGVIDGYFHQDRSVRHKEILYLLEAGVRVFGAASMGALRAAELSDFGMKGIGRIFSDFSRGALTADDEVAVLHSDIDSDYRCFSVPLVNLRYTLRKGVEEQRICHELAEGVISAVAKLPYPQRTHARINSLIQDEMGPYSVKSIAICKWIAANWQDAKREDALALIAELQELSTVPVRFVHPRQPSTIYLRGWLLNNRKFFDEVSDSHTLRICQLFATNYRSFYAGLVRDLITMECRIICGRRAAVGHGAQYASSLVDHAVHRGVLPANSTHYHLARLRPWITQLEAQSNNHSEVVETALIRSFRIAPGIPPDSEAVARLKTYGRYLIASVQKIIAAAQYVDDHLRQRDPNYSSDLIADTLIVKFLSEDFFAVSVDTLRFEAMSRGFVDLESLIVAFKQFYFAVKYNPGRLVFEL